MKKGLMLCCLVVLLICSSCAPTSKETSSKVSVTPAGEFPIVKEEVTLKIFTNPGEAVGDLETNKTTKYLEEKSGVKIEWERAGQDSNERINLMLASGRDLPDVFMTWGFPSEQSMLYGTQGLFLPLNDYIEQYGVNMKKMFEYDENVKKLITSLDGNIYGIPAYNEATHIIYSQRAYLNQQWLDNLGLAMPTTTDEFYEVLKAFKTQDPNGNGKQDEIPFSATNGWMGNIDGFLMQPFIYNEGDNTSRLILKDGKVTPAFTQNEWREGLIYMNKLYSEGLIDPEVFITNGNQIKMLVENVDGNRIGGVTSGVITEFVDMDKDTKKQYVIMDPLTGPTGLKQCGYYPYSPVVNAVYVITKDCKNPEVAFRFGDMLLDINSYRGEENVDWRKATDADKNILGEPAKYVTLQQYGTVQNTHWGGVGPTFYTQAQRFEAAFVDTGYNTEKYLYEAALRYQGNEPDNLVPPLLCNPKDAEELARIKTAVDGYVEESIAAFITGKRDIAAEWEAYLEELEKMDLDSMMEIMQNAYEAQYK